MEANNMEDLAQDENKYSHEDSAVQVLLQLQSNGHGTGNTFYIRRDKGSKVPAFQNLDRQMLEQQIRTVEDAGLVTVKPYVPPWIDDGTGHRVINSEGKVDSNIIQLDVTPKAEALLKRRTTVTRTETTVQEVFQPPEGESKEMREARRQFSRTDRGIAILNPDLEQETMLSDIEHHIRAIRSGLLTRGEFRASQYWLKYWLLYRWIKIPANVRHEVEDCRDLDYTHPSPRKKRVHT